MFGTRKDATTGESMEETSATQRPAETASTATSVPVATPRAPETIVPPRAAPAHVAPRSIVEIPRAARRSHSLGDVGKGSDSEASRTLRVGKGLSVAGEITSCDILVVEGKVEAKLNDGKMLEITESGQFRGSVEIENADIAGRYDGQLVVHGRLTVRSTGRISGMVKYGELEINAGGQIIGEMQVAGNGNAAANPAYKAGMKYTAAADEVETAAQAEQRRTA
jgi:cytoskeletal protein CcmA (bactofilin family)